MVRHLGVAVLSLAFTACAIPDSGGPRPDANGRGVDLAGFITSEAADFASGAQFDFALTAPNDMAGMAPADMTSASACGAITSAGQCAGNTLESCSASNQLTTVDCAADGRQCSVTDGTAGCHYVDGAPCGSVPTAGICDGNLVVFCFADTNQLIIFGCSSSLGGTTCTQMADGAHCV